MKVTEDRIVSVNELLIWKVRGQLSDVSRHSGAKNLRSIEIILPFGSTTMLDLKIEDTTSRQSSAIALLLDVRVPLNNLSLHQMKIIRCWNCCKLRLEIWIRSMILQKA